MWRHADQVTSIDLITPISTREKVTIALQQAGDFLDAVTVQTLRAYRDRVRRIKLIQKMRWAVLLAGRDSKNEPRIIKLTEQIEQQLNDLVDSPSGLASRPPDLKTMTAAILASFSSQAFASTRQNREREDLAREAQEFISDGQFTKEELRHMTAELLQCRIVANATGDVKFEQPKDTGSPTLPAPHPSMASSTLPPVGARLLYDDGIIGQPSSIDYVLTLPESELR